MGSESGDREKPVEESWGGDAVSSRHDGCKDPGPGAAGGCRLGSREASLRELRPVLVRRRGCFINLPWCMAIAEEVIQAAIFSYSWGNITFLLR